MAKFYEIFVKNLWIFMKIFWQFCPKNYQNLWKLQNLICKGRFWSFFVTRINITQSASHMNWIHVTLEKWGGVTRQRKHQLVFLEQNFNKDDNSPSNKILTKNNSLANKILTRMTTVQQKNQVHFIFFKMTLSLMLISAFRLTPISILVWIDMSSWREGFAFNIAFVSSSVPSFMISSATLFPSFTSSSSFPSAVSLFLSSHSADKKSLGVIL